MSFIKKTSITLWLMYWVVINSVFANNMPHHQVKVAVASNFIHTFEALKRRYLEITPNAVLTASFASSGKLYAQIKHGAPFDILLSADRDKISQLISAGLAEKQNAAIYAVGQLALASSAKLQSPQAALLQQEYQFIALANDKLAPYGLAAEQTLANLKVEVPANKKIQGENISQTLQFFLSGHADLAFVAMSQLTQVDVKNYWLIPSNLHQPIYQEAVVLNRSLNRPAVLSFFEFLTSLQAQCLIQNHGYKSLVCSD
ncbi:molybdate ABC transporter substrate-binding protein [Catenovulum agarivorans DS-2]|uniref:Molybdate ABC transporter substrate-binding protein n=1 Tax=Catenovulum agarivorans DS-2 TaxID=1328313 RepID=W7QKC1_9ALTE|nr:molybdate ABC transporter substrate-binding protein [Catenovulum agarivorans]EWH12366.1 molybdate ABC transporter substrate-binding protein [Catenovulum agarivorans DS-2]